MPDKDYLAPIDDDDTTGTTVHFMPDGAVRATDPASASEVSSLARWPNLNVELVDKIKI